MPSKFFAPALLSLVATAALVACGGGSGGGTATGPSAPTADAAATTASVTTASNMGATVIAGASSDEEVYNMAADIGDSWQLVLNNKTNKYVIKMLATSLYSLSDTSPAAFTKTTVGTVTTIKDDLGTALSVQIDSRTKSVAGNVKVGGKTASVSGSGYAVGDASKLAGNYFFLGATRNLDNGQFRDNPKGSFIISANGQAMTLCDQGIVVNGACAVLPGSGVLTVNSKALTVSKDGVNGVLRLKDGVKDFGALHVSAGDRGPVLILDRFGLNDDNVRRAGVIFAVKPTKLAGTEFDGTFNCNNRGNDGASVVVTGTSYTVKDLVRGTTNTGTLTYNKIANTSGVAIDLDGTAIAQNKGETPAQGSLVLPLSSSLAILSHGDGTLDICRKAI